MLLITGAAGFIGSALTYSLNTQGRRDLILCDRFGNQGKWKNLLGCKFWEFVPCEKLFEALETEDWVKHIDIVLHLGAHTDTTETDVDSLFYINTEYSKKLCNWAVERGIRFIYASSAAIYGDGSLGFSDDDLLTPHLRPLNAYGFSKWLFDMWVLEHNLIDKVVGLRFFNVFGPNEYHKGAMASVIYRAFPMISKEGRIRLFESHREDYTHGEQKRDFIYITDVIKVLQYFISHPELKGIFNVGTSEAHSFNELAYAMFLAIDKSPQIEYFPMPDSIREQYQYFTKADLTKLRKTGFTYTFTPFKEAVIDYVRNYLVPGRYLAT
jgi:ADP-L-glycero-D-manno-heptose 6-epimerase